MKKYIFQHTFLTTLVLLKSCVIVFFKHFLGNPFVMVSTYFWYIIKHSTGKLEKRETKRNDKNEAPLSDVKLCS